MTTPLPVRRHSRRQFLAGGAGSLALAALLAACGDDETGTAAGTSSSGGYPRTVTDASGTDVVIPARPERIVTCQNVWDLDAVLALGLVPVQFGVRDFSEYTGDTLASWPWHERVLADAGEDVERIPAGEGPDAEAIAAARPDLVIGDSFLSEARGVLEPLAPVLEIASFDWRRNLRLLGEVMDLGTEAETLISETDDQLAQALSAYELDRAPTVAVFGAYDATAFYLFGHDSIPVVDLLGRAGFSFLDDLVADATADEPRIEYSIEQIGLLEPADVIVVFDYGSDGTASQIAEQALVARLPAVEAGRLVVIPQGERAQGLSVFGPLDVQLGVDLIREVADLVE